MKKLITGLFAALLGTAGLVGVAETSATAVACPYTGCVKTTTSVSGPSRVLKGNDAEFCVAVRSGGNGRPKGAVTLTISRDGGGFSWSRSKGYGGTPVCFDTPDFDRIGDYTASAHFERDKPFKNSNDSTSFTVFKKKKH